MTYDNNMTRKPKKIQSFTIPIPILAALEKECSSLDCSRSDYVSRLLFEVLKGRIPEKDQKQITFPLFPNWKP